MFCAVSVVAVTGQLAIRSAGLLCTQVPTDAASWPARLGVLGLGLFWSLGAIVAGRIATGDWLDRTAPWPSIAAVLAITFSVVGMTFRCA